MQNAGRPLNMRVIGGVHVVLVMSGIQEGCINRLIIKLLIYIMYIPQGACSMIMGIRSFTQIRRQS